MHQVTDSSTEAGAALHAWQQQSKWSQAANNLKRSIGRARGAVLVLTVVGALLATGAAQASSWNSAVAKGLSLAAAVAVALGPIVGGFTTLERTRDWTRLRSVSEAIKADVYTYLAKAGPFTGPDADRILLKRLDTLEKDTADLRKYSAGIDPVSRELPAVDGIESYIRERLDKQVYGYYRPNARKMRDRVRRVRWAEITLSAVAAILAVLASVYGKDATVAWVAAVTTVTAAVTAHGAASRYEYQEIEYARTADELDRVKARHGTGEVTDLVGESEHVISIQNEGWMAKLNSPEP